MSDPKIVDFKPRWMRELSEDDRRLIEDLPPVGVVPEGPPRLHTRLVLAGERRSVSFKTLSETLQRTQAIVQFAACDVFHGVNPDFADLRSAGAEVLQLGKLTAEPFEEGSLLVPARLEAVPVQASSEDERRMVTTQDVLDRFNKILGAFASRQPATEVSIGAIQVIEALGQVIRREAEAIEYSLFDTLGRPAHPIRVTRETIDHVSRVRQARRPTQARLETLAGTITALDLAEQKLVLSLEGSGERVKGTYSMLFQPTLVECLGRPVRLQGRVERRGRRVLSVRVESVEVPDEEE